MGFAVVEVQQFDLVTFIQNEDRKRLWDENLKIIIFES